MDMQSSQNAVIVAKVEATSNLKEGGGDAGRRQNIR
jgi:hypothetical protein